MPTAGDWAPERFQATWAKFRAVFVAVGITEQLTEIDELAANAELMLGSRDTWWYRFEGGFKRIAAALSTVDPVRARAAMPAVRELCVLTDHIEEMRRARTRSFAATPRGRSYCEFLLAAQMKLQDPALSAMSRFIPTTVLRAVDLELRDAVAAPEPERRMRALALLTKTAMESYYKPILTGVWAVSALMVGKPANNPPAEIGPLFRDLRDRFWPQLSAPWPNEFIDENAKFVRNAAAHANVRFDATTGEVVLANHGDEQRLTEQELRQRLGNLFERAETMRSAFLVATGNLDQG